MIHVVVASALPLAICAAIYVARGFRASGRLLLLGPLAMLVSGVVAVIPDLPRLWGDQVKYVDWHHRSWCNLSWGHCVIDKHDAIDSWPGWTLIAIAIGALVLGVAWRELRILEARWRT